LDKSSYIFLTEIFVTSLETPKLIKFIVHSSSSLKTPSFVYFTVTAFTLKVLKRRILNKTNRFNGFWNRCN
jgi:hypothetical protein